MISSPTNSPLSTTIQSAFNLLIQSNQPVQEELQKIAKTFHTCMEDVMKTLDSLAKKNAMLEEQLIVSETANREMEKARQLDTKAMMDKNETIEMRINQLGEELRNTKEKLQTTNKELDDLRNKFNGHSHLSYCPETPQAVAHWMSTQGPSCTSQSIPVIRN